METPQRQKQYLSPVYPTAPDWHYLASGRLSLSFLDSSLAFRNPFFHISAALSPNSPGMGLRIDKVSKVSRSFSPSFA